MNDQAKLALTRARAALILDQPFFGTLALRLRLIERTDIPTMAVDGKRMFYNPSFVLKQDMSVLKAAVAHEVSHCVFDHCRRVATRNRRKWNAAGDYVINDMLKKSGFVLGDGWLIDPAFAGMTADHVYTLLPDGEDGPSAFDEVLPGGGEDGEGHISEADAEMQRMDWVVATVQAAEAAKAVGKLPGELQRFVTNMTQPKVDWRTQLRNLITEKSKDDYSWQHPNRRFIAYGMVLPGLYSENFGTLAVVTDDSGSIDQPTFDAFSAEICAIRDSVRPEKTIHMSCDARVNHYREYTREDEFKMESHGGGGTDFRPPFDKLEEENIEPKVFVYLTDGYGPFPETPPAYPVIWCMTTEVVPSFGDTVRIEV